MSKKSKEKLDEFNLDGDLDDLGMDGLDFGGDSSNNGKKRSTTMSILKGVKDGVFDQATSSRTLATLLKKSLPKEFDTSFDEVDKITKEGLALYNDTIKDLKPQLTEFSKQVEKLVPSSMSRTKNLVKNLRSKLGLEDNTYKEVSAAQQQETSITSSLATIFGAQEEANKVKEEKEEAREELNQKREDSRFKTNVSLLTGISNNINRLTAYNDKVNQAFQKKSLELQYRSYFALAEIMKSTTTFHKLALKQNEAIIKNTSLPDSVKATSSDRVKDMFRKKFTEGAMNSVFGNLNISGAINKVLRSKIDKVKEDVLRKVSDSVFKMTEINDGLEMTRSMGLDNNELTGNTIAGLGMDSLINKVAKVAHGYIDKNHPEVKKFAKEAAAFVAAGRGTAKDFITSNKKIEEWRNSDSTIKSALANFLTETGYEAFGSGKVDGRIEGNKFNMKNMNDPAQYSNKTRISIEEVIPGYLARIHQEVKRSNLPEDQRQSVGLLRFNYNNNSFTGQKAMGDYIAKDIKKSANTKMNYYLDRATDTLVEDKDSKEYSILKNFLGRYLFNANNSVVPEVIFKSSQFKNLSNENQEIVKKIITSKLNKETTGNEDNRLAFATASKDVQENIGDIRPTVEKWIDAGYSAELERQGIISKAGDGDFDINEDKFLEYNMKGYTPYESTVVSSDINVKEDIKSVNTGGALSKIRNTGIFKWFYKDGKGDGKGHVGPMAQDVHKNMGDAAAPNGKKVDLVTLNGINMAAIQELDEKVKSIKSSPKRNEAYLRAIAENTFITNKILSTSSFGGGGGYGGYNNGRATIGSTLDQIFDLSVQGISAGASGINKIASTGYNKIVKPGASKIWDGIKASSPYAKKGAEMLFSATTRLASGALSFANKTLFEHVPAGFKKLTEWFTKGKNWVKDQFNKLQDVYIKGKEQYGPVLRANAIKAGAYIDSNTGKVIESLKDITGTVIDRSGNVVIEAKDLRDGFVDSFGKTIRNTAFGIKNLALGAGVIAFRGLKKGLGALSNLGGYLANQAAGAKDWLSGRMNGLTDQLEGIMGGKKHYDALLDIRNILLFAYPEYSGKLLAEQNEAKKLQTDTIKEIKSKVKDSDLYKRFAGMFGFGNDDTPEQVVGGSSFRSSPSQRMSLRTQVGASKVQGTINNIFNKDKRKVALDNIKKTGSGYFNKAKESLSKLRRPNTLPKAKGSSFGGASSSQTMSLQKQSSRSVRRNLVSKGLGLLKPAKLGGTLLSLGKGLLGGAGGLLGGMLGGNSEEAAETNVDMGKGIQDPVDNIPQEKAKVEVEPGTRKNSMEERLANQEANKNRNRNANQAVDLTAKYKSSTNVLDKMGGVMGGIFGKLLGGSNPKNNVFGEISEKLTEIADNTGGVTDILTKGNKLSKLGKIGRFLKGGFNLAKGAGKFALRGGLGLGKVALGAAKGIGSIASTLGGSTVISTIASVAIPVAIAGAAVYGAYKLYKYCTRDETDEWEDIRVRQYGIQNRNVDKHHVHTLLGLEQYLLDGRISWNGKSPTIIKQKFEMQDILESFDIDKEDNDMINKFNDWFANRFQPFFYKHISAMKEIRGNSNLKDLSKLTDQQKTQYLSKVSFESGPYDNLVSPFKDKDTLESSRSVVKVAIEDLNKKFSTKAAEDAKNGTKKDATEAKNKDAENKQATENKQAEVKEQAAKNTVIPPLKPPPTQNTTLKNNAEGDGKDPGGNTYNKPTGVGKDPNTPSAPVPIRGIAMAPGDLKNGSGADAYLKLANNGVSLAGLNPEMLRLFRGMVQEYGEQTGKSITVTSGYRSYQKQAELHRKDPKKAAAPGRSLHEFGLALDVNSADLDAMEKLGLMKKYGFTRPVGGETWHTESAGIQVNLQRARDDKNFASSAISTSPGLGGDGVGSEKNKFRKSSRDTNYAIKIAGLKGSVPKVDTNTTVTQNTQVASNTTSANSTANTSTASYSNSSYPTPNSTSSDTAKSVATNTSGSTPKGGLKDIITNGAKKVGINPNLLNAFAAVESDFKPNAGAKTSSAKGLFQFTKGTWNEQLGKYGKKFGIPPNATPFDPEASSVLAANYLKNNLNYIKDVKSNPNTTDAYLTHFLGAGGAKTFLKSGGDAIGAAILPKAAAANKSIFYSKNGPKTTGQIYQDLNNRVEQKAKAHGIEPPSSGPMTTTGDNSVNMNYNSTSGATTDASTRSSTETSGSKFGGAAPTSPSSGTAMSQGGDNTASALATTNSVLNRQLQIQTEMRDLLKQILDSSGIGGLEKGLKDLTGIDLKNKTNEAITKGTRTPNSNVVNGVLDLARKIA